MKLMYGLLFGLLLPLFITQCTFKKSDPRSQKLESHLKQLEEEMSAIESELNDKSMDDGKRYQLQYKRDLLKSRMQRIEGELAARQEAAANRK